ncbi:RNase H-like domain found in reverse transcriptase [Popillia japonica]|uniref:RNase H-like domain found in reverse transcriptase n=1 Tax=Popillia japonica TaxID=7064 RepID=A0AAW1M249_POPJA
MNWETGVVQDPVVFSFEKEWESFEGWVVVCGSGGSKFGVVQDPVVFSFEKEWESFEGWVVVCGSGGNDVLVCGRNNEEHTQRLTKLFTRLQNVGLKVRPDKCSFSKYQISYLGYIIDKDGLRTSPDKLTAITNASEPENIKQLQAVLDVEWKWSKDCSIAFRKVKNILASTDVLVHYNPDYPLRELLKKDVQWKWSKDCSIAFRKVKNILASTDVLVHYNPDYPLRLITDASPYGLGSVLCHILPDGQGQYRKIKEPNNALAVLFDITCRQVLIKPHFLARHGKIETFILMCLHFCAKANGRPPVYGRLDYCILFITFLGLNMMHPLV